MAQASTYDRKSVTPGLDTWFANTFDLYGSSTSLSQTTLTPDLTLPAGNAVLGFDITGKNALSTDYDFVLDYVQIKKL